MASGHICVDLDGTLAEYTKWHAPDVIGEPIPKMVDRVKKWLAEGIEVRICTARVFPLGMDYRTLIGLDFENYEDLAFRLKDAILAKEAIERWCLCQFGNLLPIVCYKTFKTYALYDDRAYRVTPNEGTIVGEESTG